MAEFLKQGATESKVQSHRRFKWMLLGFGLMVFPLLLVLGFWQLDRAQQKTQLLADWQRPAEVAHRLSEEMALFSPVQLSGSFDPQRWLVLDNRTRHGRAGYELIGVFAVKGMTQTVLVNLGWVEASNDRGQLPEISIPTGEITISGRVTQASRPLVLSQEQDLGPGWPKRIQRIEQAVLESLLEQPLYPNVIRPSQPVIAGVDINWTPTVMTPAKHQAYAAQWFALALALLGLLGWSLRQLRREERDA